MRVDATVTEAPLSAAPAAEPGTAVAAAAEAEGTATQRTSAQVQGTQGSRSRSGSSSNSTGSGDGYGGNGTRVASRVLTRMRLMVTSELLRAEAQGPCPASGCSSGVGCGHVGGEADCAGGSAAAHSGWRRRLAAAQHPAVVSHQQLLAARAADAYPDGGYDRFIEGWKQQLQDRRRHRRKQQRYGEQHEQQREENGQGPPPARRRSRVGGVESDSDTPHDGAHGPSQAYRAHVGSWRVSSVRRGGSSTGGSGISGSSSKGPHGARGSPTEGLAPGELRSSIIGSGTPIPNREPRLSACVFHTVQTMTMRHPIAVHLRRPVRLVVVPPGMRWFCGCEARALGTPAVAVGGKMLSVGQTDRSRAWCLPCRDSRARCAS